jgi:hypothetical protein
VIAPHGGELGTLRHKQVVERTNVTARSVEFDAVVVADGAPKDNDIKAVVLLQEAYRQLKPFAAWGDGAQVLTRGRHRHRGSGRPHRHEREEAGGRAGGRDGAAQGVGARRSRHGVGGRAGALIRRGGPVLDAPAHRSGRRWTPPWRARSGHAVPRVSPPPVEMACSRTTARGSLPLCRASAVQAKAGSAK